MNISIGKRIQTFRKQKGMSQQDLSDYLGITRQAISKWELDQTLPDLETLVKMAELFEISLNELIGVEENSKSISELYDLMQTIVNTQQKANKKRDFVQLITIILCVLSLLLNTLSNKTSTPRPQKIDEPITSNTIISNMYEFTKDRFNQLPSSPFLSEKSNIQLYYYNLENHSVRLTGTLYLNEYSNNTTVYLTFEYEDLLIYPGPEKHIVEKKLTHTRNNEFTLDIEIPLENYRSAYLTITHEDNRTNFISLDNGIQLNYLYHVLFGHLNLTIPTDENGQLQLDTIVFDPTMYNTYRDNLFWGYWDTPLVITLVNETTGQYYDEFMVNLSEKTTHQLENPLQENSPISILISFNEVLSPFTHYDGFDYSKVIDFGMKLNDNYSDYETQIPLSFTINNTNEEYYISRLPISYDQETNIYTFEEEPFSK